MVKYHQQQLDLVFHALSDATRRGILAQLMRGESRVTDLAAPYNQSLAGISKHLKVLEQATLIQKSKQGRVIMCQADFSALEQVSAVLEELGAFWRQRLDSLEKFLADSTKLEEKNYGICSERKIEPAESRRKKGRARNS